MEYVFYAVLLIVSVLILGIALWVLRWLWRLLLSRPRYQNKLNLTFLSRFPAFQKPTRQGALFGTEKELLQIAEEFEEMRRSRRSVVELIKTPEEREACRSDLLQTIKMAKTYLEVERHTPTAEVSKEELLFELILDWVSRRKWRAQRSVLLESLIEKANNENSRIEGWRPPDVEKTRRMLRTYQGECVITREDARATAVTLRLNEQGEFELYRRDGKKRILLKSFPGGQSINVDLIPAAESGQLEIVKKEGENEVIEPIALP